MKYEAVNHCQHDLKYITLFTNHLKYGASITLWNGGADGQRVLAKKHEAFNRGQVGHIELWVRPFCKGTYLQK